MFKMGMGSDIEYLKLGLLREIQIFFFNKASQHLRGLLSTSWEISSVAISKPKTQPFLHLQIHCFCSNISRKYLLGTCRNKATPTPTMEGNLRNQALISYPHLDNSVTCAAVRNRTGEAGVVMWISAHDTRLFSLSGLGFRIMNPGEILLNILAHGLLDRAISSEFLTKLYSCWEVDFGQQWLEQGPP